MHCEQCKRKQALGFYVGRYQDGVIGPRGFIPLEDALMFCSRRCIREYFGRQQGEKHELSSRGSSDRPR